MYTLHPYPNFFKSASVLDTNRLGHQRVRNLQIMQILLGYRIRSDRWEELAFADEVPFYQYNEFPNLEDFETGNQTRYLDTLTRMDPIKWHLTPIDASEDRKRPSVAMWAGHEWHLLRYQKACVDAWILSGHIDTCWAQTMELYARASKEQLPRTKLPWVGNQAYHRSQQSALIRKNAEHYGPIFPGVPNNIPMVWPINN